jgi:MscS family membrane protein
MPGRCRCVSIFLLIGLMFASPKLASAADINPLRPVDTSSPRATLQSFAESMDETYSGVKQILQEYAASGRLFPTPDERRRQIEAFSNAAKATKTLDLSDIPPILRDTVAPERAIQLKEILDRIEGSCS